MRALGGKVRDADLASPSLFYHSARSRLKSCTGISCKVSSRKRAFSPNFEDKPQSEVPKITQSSKSAELDIQVYHSESHFKIWVKYLSISRAERNDWKAPRSVEQICVQIHSADAQLIDASTTTETELPQL
jgi:hypothetical protein